MALKGTNGNDRFFGTRFDDEIFGFAGDDLIFASAGADRIDGGADVDQVQYDYFYFGAGAIPFEGEAVDVDLERAVQFGGLADGDVLIDVEEVGGSVHDDFIRGDAEDNLLFGLSGNDLLEGRGGQDELFGGDGSDSLTGGLGSDELFGDSGNDQLFGDAGNDRLDGGDGVDTVVYINSSSGVNVLLNPGIGSGGDAGGDVLVSVENVRGSLFADILIGSDVANVLNGSSGDDILAGLGGADTLDGQAGTNTATYAASPSGVTVDLATGSGAGGHATNDTLIFIHNLIGSNFIDSLAGDGAPNVLDGGGGVDVLAGRLNNDIYIVDNTGDIVIENAGQGVDEVRASTSYRLGNGAEIETLRTTNDNGNASINLTGNAFANTIVGNNGINKMDGADGADTLIGAGSLDILNGGSGADRFVWRDVTDSSTFVPAMDFVVDFDPLAGDLIDLTGVDADVFASGNQAFTFIGTAGFSGTPGEVNFVHVDGQTIIQLQTGVGADIEMGIALAGIVTPEASWFIL